MQKIDPLIRTKLRLPFTRPNLVARPRLQAQVAQGLCSPVTLITAPAGFGKTTLVASCIADCGLQAAWLSLDKDDNQASRFLHYLVAALQEADQTIGSEAAQLLAASQQAPPEAVLTSLINDLDAVSGEIVLVLDDYQFISSPAVHEEVAFLLEHCPTTLHLVIVTRSDPPLPLARLRARGRMLELRAADLSFTMPEAAQFLNDVMGLRLDGESVATLEERTEGWVVGLQMAALSMQGREDIPGFITAFSGTNRYILDYLLEEVLAGQPPEIQHFLLYTSILERLTAPLCDAILENRDPKSENRQSENRGSEAGDGSPFSPLRRSGYLSSRPSDLGSRAILEYLERANLFLIPLDDERIWYRYHHVFADLLRAQLQGSLGTQGVAQLHVRAAEWHAQYGSIQEAINHASAASDDERVERFIEQNYMELVSRGEQSWIRSWTSTLSKSLVYNRPWLCIYHAYSHSWFGELDEADLLLAEAEKHIQPANSASEAQSMLVHLSYVKSRVTAMRGDIDRAIEFCLAAREYAPTGNLALQLDTQITLGYEYFLNGDFAKASPILNEMIQSGITAGAVINTVAASCILARLHAVQGQLHKSYDVYQMAAQLIPEASGQNLGAKALVHIGLADVLCEWNNLDAAQIHIQQGLSLLPYWAKADDYILAHITLARIRRAEANIHGEEEAVEKAIHLSQERGVFSETRTAIEVAQIKLWLDQGDLQAANRWAASQAERSGPEAQIRFQNELTQIARARVLIAQHMPDRAIDLLSRLESAARSAGRMGRVIEILLLQAISLQELGNFDHAVQALTKCLVLAKPEGYLRIFLDEGQPMQTLLAQWLDRTGVSPLRAYATHLVSQYDAKSQDVTAARERTSPTVGPIEPLSERELEVLQLIALGKTNPEIARQLVVAPGTVKAHTAAIYRKLDVANRTEAVAHARQLGLLP